MSLVSFLLVYLMMFMIIFFMSLPFGVSLPDDHIEGHANSAPVESNLKFKFFISLLISLIPTFFIFWVVKSGLLNTFINNF